MALGLSAASYGRALGEWDFHTAAAGGGQGWEGAVGWGQLKGLLVMAGSREQVQGHVGPRRALGEQKPWEVVMEE